MFAKFFIPPRLRIHNEDRHATWLELFFDLVLVAAIAQVGHLLVVAQSIHDGLVYAGLFVLVFWVWCGHTIYSTRFDSDDPVFRTFTFFNMFALIAMAVEVHNVAHGHGFAFGLAYLSSRLVLLGLLGRAFIHVPQARGFLKIYLVGFGLGALAWGGSLLLGGVERYWIWLGILSIELAVPWYIWKTQHTGTQINVEHIPERFGLFTIIVLGENIFAVVNGLENLTWNGHSIAVAVLSFVLAVTLWWRYFRLLDGHVIVNSAEQKQNLRSGQPYIYSHLPLLLGVVAIGIGIMRLISEIETFPITEATLTILLAGYGLFEIGIALLQVINSPRYRSSRLFLIQKIMGTMLIILFACFGKNLEAVVIITVLCSLPLLLLLYDVLLLPNKDQDSL